jgi:hypothetical protein
MSPISVSHSLGGRNPKTEIQNFAVFNTSKAHRDFLTYSNEFFKRILRKKERIFFLRDERREKEGFRDCSGSVSRDARTGRQVRGVGVCEYTV